MTSTEFNVGLADGRASSRVLKPPGGGHTNLFSKQEEETPSKRNNARNQGSEILGCFQTESPKKDQQEPVKEDRKEKQDENKKTEETTSVPQPQRVRVPPGGFSSGLW